MKIIVGIVIGIAVSYFGFLRHAYNCGEVAGQATQFSYYKSFYSPEIGVKDAKGYGPLHQWSEDASVNPFCLL